MDQTAHISLQLPAISKSVRDKINRRRRILLGAPACISLIFLFRLPGVAAVSVCRCSVVRFGEGVFTDRRRGPQGLFSRKMTFFLQPRFCTQNLGVSEMMATIGRRLAQEDYPWRGAFPGAWGDIHRLGGRLLGWMAWGRAEKPLSRPRATRDSAGLDEKTPKKFRGIGSEPGGQGVWPRFTGDSVEGIGGGGQFGAIPRLAGALLYREVAQDAEGDGAPLPRDAERVRFATARRARRPRTAPR